MGRTAATSETATSGTGVRVRLKRSVLIDGVLSYFLITLPVFLALYLLGGPRGKGALILGIQSVTLVALAVAYGLNRRTVIEVDEDSILERPFLGRTRRHRLANVSVVAIAETYRASSADTVALLFVADSRGRRMLRMRGIFWDRSDIDAVARAIGGDRMQLSDPISTAELFARYPGSRYWHEANPLVRLASFVVIAAAGGGAVVALMDLSGIPFFWE